MKPPAYRWLDKKEKEMKIIVNVKQEADAKYLVVDAGVRYWEDSEINGVADTESGDKIPCRIGDRWKPVIDIDTGQIINWKKGVVANIHYKVCDDGNYYIQDKSRREVLSRKDSYVPDLLNTEDGDGDYIVFEVDGNGFIKDWQPTLEDFDNDDE